MKTHDILQALEDRDKVTDVSDRATQVEEEEALHRMAAHSRRMVREQEPLPDGTYETTECDECGLPINPERLRVSIKNRHCIHCATLAEQKAKTRR